MSIFIDYNPEGKTLNEVQAYVGDNWGKDGVAVFVKKPEDEPWRPGVKVAEELSLRLALNKHPELWGALVVAYNDFMGQSVFRVVESAECDNYAGKTLKEIAEERGQDFGTSGIKLYMNGKWVGTAHSMETLLGRYPDLNERKVLSAARNSKGALSFTLEVAS